MNQASPVRTADIPAGALETLFFSECEAGVDWYLTVVCESARDEQVFVSLSDAESQESIFGTIQTTNFGILNTATGEQNKVWSILNTTDLPNGTPQRIVDIRYTSPDPTNSQFRITRGNPAGTQYINCEPSARFYSITGSLTEEPRWFSWLPCNAKQTNGALYILFTEDNYNMTVTTRGWGTLPVNTVRSGTLAGSQIHVFVPSVPASTTADPTQFTFFDLSATGATLSAWNNEDCTTFDDTEYSENGFFHFCPGSGFSLTPKTTFFAVQGDSPATASVPYSLNSTSYALGSRYRTDWNTANDVTVTFDAFTNQRSRRTVEWDNDNEGWQITMTYKSSGRADTIVSVFDDCTFKANFVCRHNGDGSTCVFGTATSNFPGSFKGSKIRLLLQDDPDANQDYSVTFHYEEGGNCRAITNLDQRFCSHLDEALLYNFVSAEKVDEADDGAKELYEGIRNLYNTSAVNARCLNDLKTFACQIYFRACDGDNFNVEKAACGKSCDNIANSCGANPCFDDTCDSLECPDQSAAPYLLGMLPILSFLFFVLSHVPTI